MINHSCIDITPGSIQKISISKRIDYLNSYPLFCLLTAYALQKLATLFREIYIQKDETIVRERDDFDGFFLIVSGSAVASRTLKRVQKTNAKRLATLRPGQAIGIGDTGYFSRQGKRSATVTASSPMLLLHIDLLSFYSFLKAYAPMYPALISTSEEFLLNQYLDSASQATYANKAADAVNNKFSLFAQQQMLFHQNNDKNVLRSLLKNNTSGAVEDCDLLIQTKPCELGLCETDLNVNQVKRVGFFKKWLRTITTWVKGNTLREQKK